MSNKKRNKSVLYQLSAILILIGAAGFYFQPSIFKYVTLIGVAGFGAITLTSRYPGKSIRGKRLYNMQILAAVLMIVSVYLMFSGFSFWVLTLAVAAVLILYSAFALPSAIKKEEEQDTKPKK